MLLDHVRETFLLHRQVSDPMNIDTTEPALFISRTLAHLCAPVFVLLTGLSAFLYGEKYQGRGDVSAFLFKRGLFLVVLEFTLVNFAWTFQLPPSVIYMQVIWAIGVSMIALAALVWLPRPLLIGLALVIIGGHNLLDSVHFAAGSALHAPWAILHERSWIEVGDSLRLRTTYPVLPWIGVIALGYGIGPWFSGSMATARRQRYLLLAGVGALVGFVVLRVINGYGEAPWQMYDSHVQTLMSFFNITKYPPSLLFLALTLGVGLLLLLGFERAGQRRWIGTLAVFGAAPMFFYLLHLYVLKVLYVMGVALFGLNQGTHFGFDNVTSVWLVALLLPLALYLPVRWFAGLKARRRDIAWLKYL
ncbi:heparan-alpha-glucosaminide N-acetyltransferase domain-containing protein [Pseudomonas proteolytica]|nr:heparan-alpha-glucosaminide N-acetyltransferase domain-containing protein [Pseudomonas proteolytica]